MQEWILLGIRIVAGEWAAYTQIPTILTKNTTQNIHIQILLPVNSLAFLGTDYILFFRGERVSSHDLTTSTSLVYGNISYSNVNSSFSSAPFFSFGSVKCWQDFKLMLVITIF